MSGSPPAAVTELSHDNGVVRVGETVRRPVRPFSPSVQAVLRHRFVPLSTTAPPELRRTAVQARRLASFCDAYGAGGRDRGLLLATVGRRVEALRLPTAERAARSESVVDARVWQEHADLYAADVSYLQASAAALGDRL